MEKWTAVFSNFTDLSTGVVFEKSKAPTVFAGSNSVFEVVRLSELAAAQAEIERLQSALDVAVEGLDAISKKYPQVGDCMTYPELASAALDKIKQIKNSTQ